MKVMSGTSVPDDVALWVGRFVMYFGYLEFQLWFWYYEIFDDQEKAVKFVDKMLAGKIGATKGAIEGLKMSKEDRKRLLAFLDEVISLAKSRNLVCHNPYFTIEGREGEGKEGAIFGVRQSTINLSTPVAYAQLAEIRGFANDAARLCGESHQLFPLIHAALPSRN